MMDNNTERVQVWRDAGKEWQTIANDNQWFSIRAPIDNRGFLNLKGQLYINNGSFRMIAFTVVDDCTRTQKRRKDAQWARLNFGSSLYRKESLS